MSAPQPLAEPSSIEPVARQAYSALAPEYDGARHITTRNFDLLVGIYLEQEFLASRVSGRWLDVGCGRSRLRPFVARTDLVLVDISLEMLEYSIAPSGKPLAAVGSAFALPFKSGSFAGVFASLGDPFTHPAFFGEARRMLQERGRVVHIVPAIEWGAPLRAAQGIPLYCSHFFRGDTDRLAPSFLYSSSDLAAMLRASGFTDVVTRTLSLPPTLAVDAISPDIHRAAEIHGKNVYAIPILTVVEGRIT